MRVVILGASVRAAAASARRAGLGPFGIDLFADRDLAALGPAVQADPSAYPAGLFEAAEKAPPGPWLYTGGLENHPNQIDRLAARRPLWGIGGDGLRAVRDPGTMAGVLREAGLPSVEVRNASRGVPSDGSWLVKPLASAGGREIQFWNGNARPTGEPVYYQRWIPGESHAALFLGKGGGADLIGVTAQWLGQPGRPFAYRGSVGPIRLPQGTHSQIERTGQVLATAFGLVGLFGIDLVVQAGRAWPIEVNPRYTASVEVLERVTGRSLIDEHRRVFEDGVASPPVRVRTERPPAFGKVVVMAPRDIQAPALDGWKAVGEDGHWPRIADVPRPGTLLKTGEPVFTLLQAGASPESCRARLERRLAHWQTRLGRSPHWDLDEADG